MTVSIAIAATAPDTLPVSAGATVAALLSQAATVAASAVIASTSHPRLGRTVPRAALATTILRANRVAATTAIVIATTIALARRHVAADIALSDG